MARRSSQNHPPPLPCPTGTWQERWAAQEQERARKRVQEAAASFAEVRKLLAPLGVHCFAMKDGEGRYRAAAGRMVKDLKMESVHDVVSRAWTCELDVGQQTIGHHSHGEPGWDFPPIILKRPWTLLSWAQAIAAAYKAEGRKVTVQLRG